MRTKRLNTYRITGVRTLKKLFNETFKLMKRQVIKLLANFFTIMKKVTKLAGKNGKNYKILYVLMIK